MAQVWGLCPKHTQVRLTPNHLTQRDVAHGLIVYGQSQIDSWLE